MQDSAWASSGPFSLWPAYRTFGTWCLFPGRQKTQNSRRSSAFTLFGDSKTSDADLTSKGNWAGRCVGGGFLIFKAMEKTMLAILVGATFLLFSFSQPGFTQSGDEIKSLQKEIEALKEGQKRIQRDLDTIKNFLREGQASRARGRQAPRPFQPVVLSIGDEPFKGDRSARVTIVDFSDYQ